MPRKNYDRMYKSYVEPVKENVKEEEIIPEAKEEIVNVEPKKEVKEEKESSSFIGTVIGGASLNVRKNPNGEIITSIKNGAQVVIVDDSNPEWYKIESPEKGYVMKKFVQA